MRDLAGLRKEFNGDSADGLVQAVCGGLEGGKAADAPSLKLVLERRQEGPIEHWQGRFA